jgi:hypothetical protein
VAAFSEEYYFARGTLVSGVCFKRGSLSHRSIKHIIKPMMGFKAFHSARATLAGIELHHMLRKGQHQQAENMNLFEQFYALAV